MRFCCDLHVLASALQGQSQTVFRLSVGIARCGIKIGNAAINRRVDDANRCFLRAVMLIDDALCTKTQQGYLPAGASEWLLNHALFQSFPVGSPKLISLPHQDSLFCSGIFIKKLAVS